jgi:hypothetical protein
MIVEGAFLMVMVCSGDIRDQNCGDQFYPESWYSVNGSNPKEECEKFLREEFDPKNYVTLAEDEYAAVRCE